MLKACFAGIVVVAMILCGALFRHFSQEADTLQLYAYRKQLFNARLQEYELGVMCATSHRENTSICLTKDFLPKE
jgi:hypothetical protein